MKRQEFKTITGRPPMWDEIKRAKELYRTGKISLQGIADLMSTEFKRKIYKKSVHRWVLYSVDKKKARVLTA